jgi:putative DNA primase/helicase
LGEPETVTSATAKYQAEQDLISQFIKDCCTLGAHEECTVKELHEAYKDYCTGNGDSWLGKRLFNESLSEKDFDRASKTGNIQWWLGIGKATFDPAESS